MLSHGMKIEIYDEVKHRTMLEAFCEQVDVVNNDSVKTLAYHNREAAFMPMVIQNGMIINLCYSHDFSDFYPKSFRIFSRTATLPGYRAKGFPRQRTMVSAAGLAAYTTPHQVDYALLEGAETILFTTNADEGMKSSRTLGRYLEKIVGDDPRFSFYDEREIYGCHQKVWKLHYRDIINLSGSLDR